MKQFFKYINDKLLDKIGKSIQANEPTSTHRIQSYLLLIPVLIMIALFCIIEIWMFIHSIYLGIPYTISTEIIIVFGMLLAHHLAVLFQKDNNIKISLDNNKKEINQTDIKNPTE